MDEICEEMSTENKLEKRIDSFIRMMFVIYVQCNDEIQISNSTT